MCQHVLLKLYWGIICTRLSSFIEKFQENRSSIFINRSLDSPLLGLIPLLPESSAVASCELPSGKTKTGQAASLLFSASERLVSGKWRRSPPTPAGSWRSREALVPPLAEPPISISRGALGAAPLSPCVLQGTPCYPQALSWSGSVGALQAALLSACSHRPSPGLCITRALSLVGVGQGRRVRWEE